MPILPEAVIALLACARIGAIHCNTFWGYSASALAERLRESGAKLLITAIRQGQSIQLGDAVQAAIPASGPELETVIWVNRLATKMPALAREPLESDQWIKGCSGQKLVNPKNSSQIIQPSLYLLLLRLDGPKWCDID